ncbi:MAG TPA: hypothetical protein VHF27_03575 [Acidimicrobiales bacterium]|nr:hypothetical protein [Acidimicrobiales bacterium]
MQLPVPDTAPQLVAPDTWLIPNLAPAGEGVFIPVNPWSSGAPSR